MNVGVRRTLGFGERWGSANVGVRRTLPVVAHLPLGALICGIAFQSCPATSSGKWLYGILIGVVTVLIRNFTGYVEGMMFAILLGNIAAPILDEMVIAIRLRKLNNE